MAVLLTANLDCPECEVTFEGQWADDSDGIQDMAEAPVAAQTCPAGHTFEAEYPGWTEFTGAG